MKVIPFAVAAGMLLAGCNQIATAQYREAMEYKIKGYEAAHETARARGDFLGMCTYAGLTAAAYTDARDPANAGAWAARRKEDCAMARTALDLP
jgi:hypothetical protein